MVRVVEGVVGVVGADTAGDGSGGVGNDSVGDVATPDDDAIAEVCVGLVILLSVVLLLWLVLP